MDIEQILKNQNYTFSEKEEGILTIKNRSIMNGCLAVLSFIAGFLFLFFLWLEPMLIILSLLFWTAPFIYSKWKYPKTIIIDQNKMSLTALRSFSFSEKFQLDEFESVEVEKDIRSSFTSAHEQGNQDFNYYFRIGSKKGNYKFNLMTLQYRKPHDNEMRQLATFLNNKISIR